MSSRVPIIICTYQGNPPNDTVVTVDDIVVSMNTQFACTRLCYNTKFKLNWDGICFKQNYSLRMRYVTKK